MNRRIFLKQAALSLAAAPLFTSSVHAVPNKPNVIYILADDLGYGDLSCYGQERFKTPHLDQMASEGIKFTQHYSGSTVCAPTRCCLMTGKHTGHAVVRGNREAQPEGQQPMPADTVTLAHLFKQAGYTTGMFGKWGLGAPGSASDPMKMGWDVFYGYNCQRHAHRYYTDYLWHNDKKIPVNNKDYTHDLIAEQALNFVRDNKDNPFFCYFPITIPHAAMEAPEEDVAPWREEWPQFENETGKYAKATTTNPQAQFAAMMTKLDNTVGDLFALLKELGIDDNTVVMFTSDNGPHEEGGHDPEFFNCNGPLKGHKRDLYEGGIRTPMIARWPGKIEPSTTTDHISAHWDVLATCADVAGFDVPEDTDGISFLPTLNGEGEQEQHEYLYWEFHEQDGKQAVRKGKWKAIKLNVSNKGPKAPIELYNLEDDIGEGHNIARKHKNVVRELAPLFETARTENGTFKLFH
jgi:arylsulfatase A-like enzyme